MNLQHLRYLVEVERIGSITKAASALFMGQPNLSKAIKEIESEMGIVIFKRSARGVVPTVKGAEFLEYAKAVLVQIEKMEKLYKTVSTETVSFSISIPRASYITYVFTQFLNKLDSSKKLDIYLKETNSMEAINNIIECEYNLGIIRYDELYEEYFISLLNEKKIKYRTLCEFQYMILVSKNHPLAKNYKVSTDELSIYTEIVHGDNSVPYLSDNYVNAHSTDRNRIYVCERGSQFDILTSVENTYMWVSPLPQQVLNRYNLVQIPCRDKLSTIKDVFIYPKTYNFTSYDSMFLDELESTIDKLFLSK
ncbi:MAG: LysR family transcriptional regulator [Ruminococcus sp.]|nr:LysR family transcriptional regulator [Ruminococcus sp.]